MLETYSPKRRNTHSLAAIRPQLDAGMSDSAISAEMPPKRRRRPPLSCEQCRKRKVRCDRNLPCNNCRKAKDASCTYAPGHTPKPGRQNRSDSSQTAPSSGPSPIYIRPSAGSSVLDTSRLDHFTSSSIPSRVTGALPIRPATDTISAASDCEYFLERINQLERRLEETTREKEAQRSNTAPQHSFSFTSAPQPLAVKGIISKTRYFGQSHWMNGATLFPAELSLLGREEKAKGSLYQILTKCKVLGRKMKASRISPLSSQDLCRNMPPKEIADGLVEAYLRTFEGVLRIVHIPTFRAEYERYWQNPSAANESFLILLQLCMALGTVFHDDPVSTKSMAIGWVYEAQVWLMLPPEKSRMTLVGIQIMCLLTLAKSVCAVGQDLTWVMAGSLLRTAMYMGLHRDPKHLTEMTTYRAEMRRRLWATILELNLQYSFESGGLPLITPQEYDTLPPSNFNDEQLTDDPDGSSTPVSEQPTQTSVQIELLKSIPLRLRLLRHVNDFRSGPDYEETLQLNSELIKACRIFDQNVSADAPSEMHGGMVTIRPFHISLSEVFLYRCFQTLHLPILCTSFQDPRYYFSRKMCLDSSLKLTELWGFSNPHISNPNSDFRRATINASGMFRNVPVQAIFVLSIELTQEKTESSTGLGCLPGVGQLDIQAYLQNAMEWTFSRVRAGEVSAKGGCFLAGCLSQAEALDKRLSKEESEVLFLRRATEACTKSWEELKVIARRLGIATGEDDAGNDTSTEQNNADELVAEWDSGWAWDDAGGLIWGGPWAQLQMPLDDDLNKFFGNYN